MIIRFQWAKGPSMHTNARHIGLTSVSLHRPLCANLERLCNFLGILLVLSVPLLGLSMVTKVTIGAGGAS